MGGFISNMQSSIKNNRSLRNARKKLMDQSPNTLRTEELLTEEELKANKEAFSDYSKQLKAEANKKSWVKPITGIVVALAILAFLLFFWMEVSMNY